MRTRVASLAVLVGMSWPGAWALGQGQAESEKPATTARFLIEAAPPSVDQGRRLSPRRGVDKRTFPAPPAQYDAVLAATPGAANVYAIVARDPADETLGATLEPVSAALREQLGLPAGRGLSVTTLDHAGAAYGAGIRDHDILLTLAGKPLAAPDDLTKQLKAVGEKEVDLTLLRAGESKTLKVRPVYRVTLGPAEMESSEYFLGVSVSALDEAMRSQLKLNGRTGLLVNEVAPGSAAEKAGIKVHDILLAWHGTALTDPADLIRGLETQEGKSGPLVYLRAGKQAAVEVIPEKRTIRRDTVHEAVRVWTMTQPNLITGNKVNAEVRYRPLSPMATTVTESAVATPGVPAPRIEALEKEIKALKSSLDEIRDLLRSEHAGAKKASAK